MYINESAMEFRPCEIVVQSTVAFKSSRIFMRDIYCGPRDNIHCRDHGIGTLGPIIAREENQGSETQGGLSRLKTSNKYHIKLKSFLVPIPMPGRCLLYLKKCANHQLIHLRKLSSILFSLSFFAHLNRRIQQFSLP